MYMYNQYFALNNLRELICHKYNQQNKQTENCY